jgi:hypothetical protein
MSGKGFVAMSELKEAIQDFDPSIDTSFMLPHWGGDWEAEVSDDELDRIMGESHKLGSVRGARHDKNMAERNYNDLHRQDRPRR